MILKQQIYWDEGRDGVADASELGWPPGQWPKRFVAELPNGQPFSFEQLAPLENMGETLGWQYYSYAANRAVKVFND